MGPVHWTRWRWNCFRVRVFLLSWLFSCGLNFSVLFIIGITTSITGIEFIHPTSPISWIPFNVQVWREPPKSLQCSIRHVVSFIMIAVSFIQQGRDTRRQDQLSHERCQHFDVLPESGGLVTIRITLNTYEGWESSEPSLSYSSVRSFMNSWPRDHRHSCTCFSLSSLGLGGTRKCLVMLDAAQLTVQYASSISASSCLHSHLLILTAETIQNLRPPVRHGKTARRQGS